MLYVITILNIHVHVHAEMYLPCSRYNTCTCTLLYSSQTLIMKIIIICKYIIMCATLKMIPIALHLPRQQCQYQHMYDSLGNPQPQHCPRLLPGVAMFAGTVYQRMKQG